MNKEEAKRQNEEYIIVERVSSAPYIRRRLRRLGYKIDRGSMTAVVPEMRTTYEQQAYKAGFSFFREFNNELGRTLVEVRPLGMKQI